MRKAALRSACIATRLLQQLVVAGLQSCEQLDVVFIIQVQVYCMWIDFTALLILSLTCLLVEESLPTAVYENEWTYQFVPWHSLDNDHCSSRCIPFSLISLIWATQSALDSCVPGPGMEEDVQQLIDEFQSLGMKFRHAELNRNALPKELASSGHACCCEHSSWDLKSLRVSVSILSFLRTIFDHGPGSTAQKVVKGRPAA